MSTLTANLTPAAIERALAAMPAYLVERCTCLSGRWYVQHGVEVGRCYLVDSRPGQVSCSCPAGQQGRPCKHRAMVAEAMREEEREAGQYEAADAEARYWSR